MKDLSNPLKVIDILSDGQCHSGEELGAIFGISRASINKYIKLIREWGIEINSSERKGYQLSEPMDLLSLEKIKAYYNGDPNLDVIPVIDSTNRYLLDNVTHLTSGFACVAEYQQSGRARRGRQWFSPFGSNLYLSMYWRLDQGPSAAMGMSLVIGIVVAELLRKLSGQDVKVKWPNDLYLNDKKLAGILVEISGKSGDVAHVVLGMGINLKMTNPDQSIVNQAWTNLGQIDRNQLVAELLHELRIALPIFEKKGLDAFIDRWSALDNFAGRQVKLLIGDSTTISGVAKGINQQGALLIEHDGKVSAYVGGEISVRSA